MRQPFVSMRPSTVRCVVCQLSPRGIRAESTRQQPCASGGDGDGGDCGAFCCLLSRASHCQVPVASWVRGGHWGGMSHSQGNAGRRRPCSPRTKLLPSWRRSCWAHGLRPSWWGAGMSREGTLMRRGQCGGGVGSKEECVDLVRRRFTDNIPSIVHRHRNTGGVPSQRKEKSKCACVRDITG